MKISDLKSHDEIVRERRETDPEYAAEADRLALTDDEPAGSLLTRVPGRAKPRAQALKEFDESVEEIKRRYKRAFWPLFVPKAEDVYRWRMQLECGCVREIFTEGGDSFPDEHSDNDPLSGSRLPKGEYWCAKHQIDKPYQEIVEWVESEIKEFPADPEEPEHGFDPEAWAVLRRTEPHSRASWQVVLACGHTCSVLTDVDFAPADGPRLVSVERRDEMRRDLEDFWAKEGADAWPEEGYRREHMRRMLDLRMPKPEPDLDCFACAYAKKVTGYQRIGWLMPRGKTAAPKTSVRERTEEQLARAEAEVERLKRRLEAEG